MRRRDGTRWLSPALLLLGLPGECHGGLGGNLALQGQGREYPSRVPREASRLGKRETALLTRAAEAQLGSCFMPSVQQALGT